MQERIKNILLYGGTDRQSFLNIRQETTESNRKNMVVFSSIVAVGMLVMILASFFDPSLVKNRTAYTVCAVTGVILFILVNWPAKGRPWLTYLCVYLFIALLLAFGIDLGTFVEPNEVTVSFDILLFAVPLLFTDRPYRIILIILAGILVYLYAASLTQTPLMQGYNRSNILPYGLISMIVSTYMMKIKIRRQVLEYENRKLIRIDQMTGLMNRRCYEEHIDLLRKEGCPTGMKVCAFDLNGLKKMNDTVGHQAGDLLICGAADCIRDVFGPYGKCYRTGGDEFVAILDSVSQDSVELRQKFDTVCREFKRDDISGLSISVGIVMAEADSDIDVLVKDADQQMYQYKSEYYSQAGFDRRKR